MIAAGEGTGWRYRLGGLSAISLGAFAISMANDALSSRQIRLQYSIIRHAQRPRLFWAAVVLVGIAGAAAVIAGVGLIVDAPAKSP